MTRDPLNPFLVSPSMRAATRVATSATGAAL